MCDCAPDRVEPGEAHWIVKLITGLIAGALIFEVVRGP